MTLRRLFETLFDWLKPDYNILGIMAEDAFKLQVSAQSFLATHAIFYNTFYVQRYLIHGSTLPHLRTKAMATRMAAAASACRQPWTPLLRLSLVKLSIPGQGPRSHETQMLVVSTVGLWLLKRLMARPATLCLRRRKFRTRVSTY